MAAINIIYGSDGGTTRKIAKKIAAQCNGRCIDVKIAQKGDFEDCSLLVLGCPTYGDGDLQSDWEEHVSKLEEAELTGKRVALFGMGDQVQYATSFVDALGILYDIVVERGAKVVGTTDPSDYDFAESKGLREGRLVGLALDEDNEARKTDKRITAWLAELT